MALQIISMSAEETSMLGEELAMLLKPGDVIALTGDLGTGKTTFTKGIARGLGVAHSEYVNSPSFTLIKEYAGRISLYHIDLYRLDDLCDMEYLGIEEYVGTDGVAVVEWAEKLKGLLPKEHLHICIKIKDENTREFDFKSYGKRYDDIISRYFNA